MTNTSPDVTPYVDLTLFDMQPQDIYLAALDQARAALPDWQPREGQMELVLLQALAMESAQTVFSINRLTGAVVEVLLQLFGLTRSTGFLAETTVTFTCVDNSNQIIPTGTRLMYQLPGVDALIFTTNTDATLTSSGGGVPSTGSVVVTAATPTAAYNGVPSGTSLTVLIPSAFLASAVTSTAIAGGSGPETDTAYFTRGMLLLGRLTEALVLPAQFERYVLENFSWVYRTKALDQINGTATFVTAGSDGAALPQSTIHVSSTTGMSTSGTVRIQTLTGEALVTFGGTTSNTLTGCSGGSGTIHTNYSVVDVTAAQPGHLSLAVCKINGGLLSGSEKTTIVTALAGNAQSNLTINAIDPNFIQVDVSTILAVAPGFDSVTVIAAGTTVLTNYFDPNLTPWTTTIHRNALIATLADIPGVAYVNDLQLCVHGGSLGTADVTSTDPAPLFTAGTFTVTGTTP